MYQGMIAPGCAFVGFGKAPGTAEPAENPLGGPLVRLEFKIVRLNERRFR